MTKNLPGTGLRHCQRNIADSIPHFTVMLDTVETDVIIYPLSGINRRPLKPHDDGSLRRYKLLAGGDGAWCRLSTYRSSR